MPYDPYNPRGNSSWQQARVLSQGAPAQRFSQQEMQDLKYQLDQQERFLDQLKKEPRLCAVVVEVREDSMLISFGPGNSVDVGLAADAKVGDRVLVKRDTMQVLELVHDEVPSGTIVTVERVAHGIVEAQFLGMLRTFQARRNADGEIIPVKVGERVVLDPSQAYVIGSLGMPPAKHAVAPKIGVSWDDIGGHVGAKQALREAIELPILHKGLFKAYRKDPIKGVLLEGPPGTGKTLLAKAAATSIARAHGENAAEGFISVKGPELLDKFVGQSEANIRGLFAAARTHYAKHQYAAVIFIDEADALLGKRDRSLNMSMGATIVPQFLAEMDGFDDFAAIMIIATNRADMLDPAIVRGGRIDRRVKVGRPGIDDARAIFDIHTKNRPFAGDTPKRKAKDPASSAVIDRAIAEIYSDRRVIRRLGEGLDIRMRDFASGSMIAEIVDRAISAAIHRDIAAGVTTPTGITEADMMGAIDQIEHTLHHIDHDEVIRERLELARIAVTQEPTPDTAAAP